MPENGKIGIEQANPNTLSREAMKDKWNQMKELGARLLKRVLLLKLLLNLTVMMLFSIPFYHFVL
ncbi:hypothetical protein K021_3996 [Acinetobacter baumannii 25442_5]|nr:hypothetical protein K021_3996 [Acinetobacter baumannii 25442_5]